jgi:hypothetical protein
LELKRLDLHGGVVALFRPAGFSRGLSRKQTGEASHGFSGKTLDEELAEFYEVSFSLEPVRACCRFCCRFSCRLTPTLSGIPGVQLRQITLSVNDLLLSCRTSYSPAVA